MAYPPLGDSTTQKGRALVNGGDPELSCSRCRKALPGPPRGWGVDRPPAPYRAASGGIVRPWGST
jgi:hypothetical protein